MGESENVFCDPREMESAERRSAESSLSERRPAERRPAESRLSENRLPERRSAERRLPERRLPESRFSERGFFHVCTNGKCISWMFKDDEDFVAGINRAGLCKLASGADVIDYTLMDNHVHFLLYAFKHECEIFINRYKQMLSTWIKNKYSLANHLKCLDSKIIPVPNRDALLELVAYIDRNAIVAGYKFLPGEYRWGAARFFFKEPEEGSKISHEIAKSAQIAKKAGIAKGAEIAKSAQIAKNAGCSKSIEFKKVSEFRKDEVAKIIKTKADIPSDWEINDEGMLNPKCFLNIRYVESLFVTPVKYLYFLSKKLEGQIDITIEDSNQRKFIPDQELRDIVKQLATSLFNCDRVATLNFKSRIELAKRLKYEYAATTRQIGRMLNLGPDSLKGFV